MTTPDWQDVVGHTVGRIGRPSESAEQGMKMDGDTQSAPTAAAPDATSGAPGTDLPEGLLAEVLSAVVLRVPERAREALAESEQLPEDLRGELLAALDRPDRSEQARALGDALRVRGRWLDPDVNECYRAAFYCGDRWQDLTSNPLFARFTANKAGLPLDKWVHYFDIYQRTLAPYLGRPVRVLEIGVFHGGGLEQLRALLGEEAILVGADVDPAAQAACLGRFDVAIGDQSDPAFLDQVVADYGPFDIIIDDGGHTMHQQIATIEHLFPTLNDGGVFMVEDTHTSYWGNYQDADVTFMDWAKDRLDDINGYHFSRDQQLGVWTTQLSGIHIYDSVVVFDKGGHFPPFCEVSGTGSFVYADRITESTLLNFRASMNVAHQVTQQALDQRSDAVEFGLKADELRQGLSAEVEKLNSEVARLNNEIGVMNRQLRWSPKRVYAGLKRRLGEGAGADSGQP